MEILNNDTLTIVLLKALADSKLDNITDLTIVCSRWRSIVRRCWPLAARLCVDRLAPTNVATKDKIDLIKNGCHPFVKGPRLFVHLIGLSESLLHNICIMVDKDKVTSIGIRVGSCDRRYIITCNRVSDKYVVGSGVRVTSHQITNILLPDDLQYYSSCVIKIITEIYPELDGVFW